MDKKTSTNDEAPIDIVIRLIERHKDTLLAESKDHFWSDDYKEGRIESYEGLIEELESFKKLFS